MKDQQYTDEELIEWMICFYQNEGYWPQLRDMKAPYPGKTTYARRFASASGKDDGFGVALELAKMRYSEREEALFEELRENLNDLNCEITESLKQCIDSFVGAMERLGNICRKIMRRGRVK